MHLKLIAAVLFTLATAAPAYSSTAGALIGVGWKVVAMTAFPDGTIALTLQGNNKAQVCIMNKPLGTTIDTANNCFTVN